MESPEVRNPFALLTNPDVVVKAMESSERLGRLRSRICRPLDRTTEQSPGAAATDDDDGEGADTGGDAAPTVQA